MKDPKNATVTAIRLRPELRQKIDRAARRVGMARSTFIKSCVSIVMASEGKREKQP